MMKQHGFWRVVGGILVFWFILLAGPYIWAVLELFNPYRLDRDSIWFWLTAIAVQGGAAYIACYAALELAEPPRARIIAVNAIIAAVIICFILLIGDSTWKEIISDIITLAALIGGSVTCFRAHDDWLKEDAAHETK